MRICELELRRGPTGARASARVEWEDSPRDPFELRFETDGSAADDLSAEPEAFATACALAAARNGERRVLVEGSLCPRLADGLRAAVALLGSWYGAERRALVLEATLGFRAIPPRKPARTALFLTCGIDSLHLLASNRSSYPSDHPDAFADCLSVYGHICAESPVSPWNDRFLAMLAGTAEQARLAVVAVRTNLWKLEPDLPFVARESLSSALVASAHLFRRRWTSISLASGRAVANEIPRGTHPMLDPLYSSSALTIRHDPSPYGRFERLRAIAASPAGVANVVVCQAYPDPPFLNCGACEKCVRTMTMLVALGRLSEARQFPADDVTPERIRAVPVRPVEAEYWSDVLSELGRIGRTDLARAVREKLAEAVRIRRWQEDAGWKGSMRRLDRRVLGGRALALRRRLFGPPR